MIIGESLFQLEVKIVYNEILEKYVIECNPEQQDILKHCAAKSFEVEVVKVGNVLPTIKEVLEVIKSNQGDIVNDIVKEDTGNSKSCRYYMRLFHAIAYSYLNKKGYRFSRGAKNLSKLKYFKEFEYEIGTRQTLHSYLKNLSPNNKIEKKIYTDIETAFRLAGIFK